jgi:anthranilate/para-aminobenzoate synthase component II
MNGDKKAIIERSSFTYNVVYYLNNKVVKKEIVDNYQKAEDLAEEYVLAEDKKGPNFLVERWTDA